MNQTHRQTPSPVASSALSRRVGRLHAQWRSYRDERHEVRALERELASYRSRRDVDDLLACASGSDHPDAELVRNILTRNPQRRDRAA